MFKEPVPLKDMDREKEMKWLKDLVSHYNDNQFNYFINIVHLMFDKKEGN